MILADTMKKEEAALAEIEPMQQKDFEGIYEAMVGRQRNNPLLRSTST